MSCNILCYHWFLNLLLSTITFRVSLSFKILFSIAYTNFTVSFPNGPPPEDAFSSHGLKFTYSETESGPYQSMETFISKMYPCISIYTYIVYIYIYIYIHSYINVCMYVHTTVRIYTRKNKKNVFFFYNICMYICVNSAYSFLLYILYQLCYCIPIFIIR